MVGARKVLAAVASYCQVSNSFRFTYCFKRYLFGDYHPEESNKAFVVPVQSQLASVGVEGHVGKAGYYFMPDFEILRPALALRWTLKGLSQIGELYFRGITTGQGMCDLMLQEAKVMVTKSTRNTKSQVALMPSSSFLLKPTDLTTRFCYVNFEVGRPVVSPCSTCRPVTS